MPKSSFDPEEPLLGRICAYSIAPPHTTTSIKKCIAKIEQNPEIVFSDMFSDATGETLMKGGHVPIFSARSPGSIADNPLVLVQRDERESPTQMDQGLSGDPRQTYTRIIKAKYDASNIISDIRKAHSSLMLRKIRVLPIEDG